MVFAKNILKFTFVPIFIVSLTFSGCSFMPWASEDEDEDLFFEEDFGKEFESEFEGVPAANKDKEDDFFKDDPMLAQTKPVRKSQSKTESVPVSPDEDNFFLDVPQNKPAPSVLSKPSPKPAPEPAKAFQQESGVISNGGGFVSVDQKTDREEFKMDVAALHSQQADLMVRVQELQKIVSNLEPRLAATQQRVESSLRSGSETPKIQEDIVSLKEDIVRLKNEIASLNKAQAPSGQAKMTRKIRPLKGFKKSTKTTVEYAQALAAYKAGRYDESILLFQEMSLKNPPQHLKDNILFWMGNNYLKLDMYDDAIIQFQAVVKQYPKGNKIHDSRYMLGVSYQKKGDTGRALDALEVALKGNPPSEVRQKIEKHLMEIK